MTDVSGGDQEDVPEWMKPNDDLLNKVKQDNELASGVDNPKITHAIDEISKDPQAWLKYQNDPEGSALIVGWLREFT